MGTPSSRDNTRETFTSTTATSMRWAKARTARAVYWPIPGSARSSSSDAGMRPSNCSCRTTAVACRLRQRRGYPRPDHSRNASPKGACASAAGVGKASRNASYFGMTRATEVCCSITSLTRTRQGSFVRRHGRSRSEPLPHSMSADAMRSCRVNRPTRLGRRTDDDDSVRTLVSTP